ncbi:alkaline phosphatase [Pseudidiomarina sp.]|uniref:alkaline phosphatase n=1 Tax=Pseudidiomarina sp. TaxID=2081707 RepID=UPI00299EC15A|nr:alkaline phosphatase [Pseudidiomarina sp.]MDX1706417.1 alkaline phosphatase [Pseudidiomarina sp.]
MLSLKFLTPFRIIFAISFILAGCTQSADQAGQQQNTTPPNIIFMIGDGMGFEYISAYRYAMSEPGAGTLAPTPFDDLLLGAATTYPDDDTWVTDSAASATALATGVKSYNGAIGIDANKHPQQNMMERARSQGWYTGAISTVHVNHATPASFFTHHPSRKMYEAIADSLATPLQPGVWRFDVLLGGGYRYFSRDDKNWLPELQQQGMTVITEFDQLTTTTTTPVLGLFAAEALPAAIDDQPRLASMTQTALRLLTAKQQQQQQPFALMVEGSQIDWCGHANDIACAVHEMKDFAQALDVVLAYQKEHPNTLIVITADHSTGGLTLGQGGEYAWYSQKVMGITASLEVMTRELLELPRNQWREYLQPRLNLELTEEEWHRIAAVEVPAEAKGRDRQKAIRSAIVPIISSHTRTGWTTSGHTAVDVPVMAIGPGSEAFRGYQDNTDIGKALLKLIR